MTGDKTYPLVRVRLAPSPTGPIHLGTARTALFNWVFAKQNQGVFILRIEDTDRERSRKEYDDNIIDGLNWLGLNWDEGPEAATGGKRPAAGYRGNYGPYRQSERTEIYKEYLTKLLTKGKAYYCYCTKEDLEAERQAMLAQGLPPKYSGHCRNLDKPPRDKKPQVIRFKTPEAKVDFKDIIRGKLSFDASLFGDLTIAKDTETPLYNFAAVVDDAEMKITHVIRGEDHLSNTPKQILMQKALDFGTPEYAHLPLILSSDRSKLSKRYAETSLLNYREEGYLPEAVINFLALLGWHPRDDEEILNQADIVKKFDLRRVQKAGAIFDLQKFEWLQKEHLRRLDNAEIVHRLRSLLKEKGIKTTEKFLEAIVAVEKTRLRTIKEIVNADNFFFKLPDYNTELLRWQKEPLAKSAEMLGKVSKIISALKKETLNREELSNLLADLISEEGRGAVLWPLRVALSGQAASPDPLEIMTVLGQQESLKRISLAEKKVADSAKNQK